jgi:ABC-type glycerol-3-phosphate transport system permease component
MRRLTQWSIVVGLGSVVAAIVLPLYWAIVASFTPEAQLFAAPSLFPTTLVLDHYRALFIERNFWVPIRNSLIVAGTTLSSARAGRRAPTPCALAY